MSEIKKTLLNEKYDEKYFINAIKGLLISDSYVWKTFD